MPTYLSFRDDSVEEFLAAFKLYRSADAATSNDQKLRHVVRAIRALTVAIEKCCKDSVARIDPYLLVSKPNREILKAIRGGMRANRAPTIFCSDAEFDTLSAKETWTLLRELTPDTKNDVNAIEFEKHFKGLVDLRNRARHSEVFWEPEEAVATVEAVLARVRPVLGRLNPEWFACLESRDDELTARLDAVENKIDAGWAVLLRYLEKTGGLEMSVNLYAQTPPTLDHVHVLFGAGDKPPNASITAAVDVPAPHVSGVFMTYLTQQEIDERRESRSYRAARRTLSELIDGTEDRPVPMATGELTVPWTNVWVRYGEPTRYLHAVLEQLELRLPDAMSAEGIVSGRMSSVVWKGVPSPRTITITGTATMTGEMAVPPTAEDESKEALWTTRFFHLRLQLASTPEGSIAADQSSASATAATNAPSGDPRAAS